MSKSSAMGNMNAKRRGLLWQPILFILIPTVILYIVISNANYTKRHLHMLNGKEAISKAELKVVSDAGVSYITLSDARQLDSINVAFQQAKRIRVPPGGATETWADLNIFKYGQEINTRIRRSPYHGWMIVVGNETLSSDYLFSLVRRYQKS